MKLSRALSLLLVFSMLLSVIPMAVFAETEVAPYDYVADYPSEDDPTVYLYEEYTEGATYQWYEGDTALEGETSNGLTAEPKFCTEYSCTVVLADSTTFTVSFDTNPYIENNPSQHNKAFYVSHTEHVTGYQWYMHEVIDVPVTYDNASIACNGCENTVTSSYDSETNLWDATYMSTYSEGVNQLFCFEVALKAGEMLLIDCEYDVSDIEISNSDYSLIENVPYFLNGNIGVFTAEADDTYRVSVFAPGTTAKVEAFIRTYDQDVLIAGQTDSYLYNIELGNYYYCVATYDNDVTLKSSVFLAAPYFYDQPEALERSVYVSYSEYASYQWYRADETATEINTYNASVCEKSSDEKSSYDSENGVWNAVETYRNDSGLRELAFFSIKLKADETIRVKTDADVEYNELQILVSTENDGYWEYPDFDDGVCIYTAYEDADYMITLCTYDEGDVTISAELVEYNDVLLEGENDDTLNEYIVGAEYYCEIAYPHCMVLVSESFTATPEIIENPTAESPKFVVSYDKDAKFQWYEAEIDSAVTVDDTMVDYSYGTYDTETGEWTPECGDPYDFSGYQEYCLELIDIELKAGETVKVTISNPDAISPKDPDMRFNGEYDSNYAEWNNGCVYFTAPEDAIYNVYQYGIYPETATFKIEKISYSYTAVEGEIGASISGMERGKSYSATASYEDGTVLKSIPFEAYPVITKQPTNTDPSVETSIIEDGMKYQWYKMELVASPLTDSDITYRYGSYDSETKEWTGSVFNEYSDGYYGLDLFEIELKAGESITFIPSEELYRGYIKAYDYTTDNEYEITPDDNGTYTLKALNNGEFGFYTYDDNENVTFKITKNTYGGRNAVEGETEAKLINPAKGAYQCVITYDEETELVSDIVALIPTITKQPTATDPSVDVNVLENGMKYQWYKVESVESIVTDSDAELTDESDPATYDSETQEWTATIYDEYTLDNGETEYELDLFILPLKRGETVIFVPSEELNYDTLIAWPQNSSGINVEVGEDGSYVFVAPEDKEYYFYFYDDNPEVTFKVTLENYKVTDAIEGETEAKLSTRKKGVYQCVITYEDGTELISDFVELEAYGDVNGNGVTDSSDYLLVKRACFNTYQLSDEELARADVNSNGDVDSSDYAMIKRIAFGTLK